MEITRDELLKSAGTEVHSTTSTKFDPIEKPSKRKKNVSQQERIRAHNQIFQTGEVGEATTCWEK